MLLPMSLCRRESGHVRAAPVPQLPRIQRAYVTIAFFVFVTLSAAVCIVSFVSFITAHTYAAILHSD